MFKLLRNTLAIAVLCAASSVAADRIMAPINANKLATLPGHVRTLARSYVDEGLVKPAQQMDGLILFLKPSAAQKTAIDQLLIDLQDPISARYHQWLTPEQYADQFAISSSDASKITTWLQAQGFQIGWVGRGRSLIVFNGTAGAVDATFHAAIHRYRSAAAVHYANTQNPSVPETLQEVVGAIGGLDDFVPEPAQHATPAYTESNGTHVLAPGDLATIYDFATMITNGIDGTGQKVVVAGRGTVPLTDTQAYNAKFGLAPPNVQSIVVPGFPTPGQANPLATADLDLQTVGAVARNATILYVYSGDAYNAVFYAIDQNLAPVINFSYADGCDAENPISTLTSFQSMAQQANAEGITWVAWSGGTGAAGCDAGTIPAKAGLSIGFPSSIPEVTAVGGTEFNEGSGNYWSAGNGAAGASALSYIPEVAWNDNSKTAIAATTGGPSTWYFKPPWQTGPGVPNDGMRDSPDVAFTESGVHDPYYSIVSGAAATTGGTSGASPLFAGMLVLLNQYLVANGAQGKPGLGNVNPLLYRLAQSNPSVFHDITSGNNIVPCAAGTYGCVNGTMGYTAGPGYDLCTGLGSIDLAQFAAAALVKPAATSVIVVSSTENPVMQQPPGSNGDSWTASLTLTEEAGVATTVTGVSVDGTSYPASAYLPNPSISAFGTANVSISLNNTAIPQTHTFAFTGVDPSGRAWTTQVSLPFTGFQSVAGAPKPAITGTTNGASFEQTYAPGMILSVFGSQLSSGTQSASGVPLLTYMQSFEATVNGVLAPIYYISPTQANVQIPYGTAPGTATLVVYQAGESATSKIQISPSAPGIFADANGNTVPYASGSAGQALVLFITGDGEVSPALPTGTTPSTSTPVTSLPQSILPASMTIGGQAAQILFDGIPYGLVGVTQINFVVPAGLAPGPQPVVITVGTASSKPATFTITSGS
jgi:uncharacterized protein (TIGR03437 family)